MNSLINGDASFSHHVLHPDKFYPNNINLPVLVYNKAVAVNNNAEEEVKTLLAENGWTKPWSGGIFNYHHYHTTAHEVLVVTKGTCMLELGGPNGNIQTFAPGDVIILPAGVVHKSLGSSDDFCVIGAYPEGQEYDMNKCSEEASKKAEKNISKVPLPKKDPIYGDEGPLKDVWHLKNTEDNLLTKERQF